MCYHLSMETTNSTQPVQPAIAETIARQLTELAQALYGRQIAANIETGEIGTETYGAESWLAGTLTAPWHAFAIRPTTAEEIIDRFADA